MSKVAATRQPTLRSPATPAINWQRIALLAGPLLLVPIALAAIAPGILAPHDPLANVAPALSPPTAAYPFGSDDLGRDMLSMIVYGARGALVLALSVAAMSITIGILVGVAAGSFGLLVDEAAMRVTEFVKILPNFLVALLVATLFGPSLWVIGLILGGLSWPGLARMVRAETVVQRQREHVVAARALGAHPIAIAWRHILPAAARPALAVFAPVATGAILAEAGLGYLGLSDASTISWGDLIRNGQAFYAHGWWLSVFPGLAIVVTCVGIALTGESLARGFGRHRIVA